jgi:hypothetical protein
MSERAAYIVSVGANDEKVDDLVAPIRPEKPNYLLFWPDPRKGQHSYYCRDEQGRAFKCRRYLHADGSLAEFWIYRCPEWLKEHRDHPPRAVDIRQIFLPDETTGKQFLMRWDMHVTPLIANLLLEREWELAPEIVRTVTNHFRQDGGRT